MSSMKLKSLEELKNSNLKGYCYFVPAWGMSQTSRHSYEPELWTVLEDNDTECIVARDDSRSWITKFPKERVIYLIIDNPAIDPKTFTNLIKN